MTPVFCGSRFSNSHASAHEAYFNLAEERRTDGGREGMEKPERNWRDMSRPRDTGGPLSPAQVSRGAEVVRSPVLGCAFARCAVSDNFCISCESSLSVCQRAIRVSGAALPDCHSINTRFTLTHAAGDLNKSDIVLHTSSDKHLQAEEV